MAKRRILLIISGSIAAYKALELIRRGRERGYDFTTILTAGGTQFITPLSCASLSENECYTDLFSLKDETEMGHIRLSRECDLLLVAPASADLLAKMNSGQCDDLASTILLATDKPVMAAPAMNHKMWENPSTQRNVQQLIEDGIDIIQPDSGELACGEHGAGRMAEVSDILDHLDEHFSNNKPLSGLSALVTAGPTHEPIDPVRFIANRSSGKQGYAIADALAKAGANVTLISGPTSLDTPDNVTRVDVQTAEEMMKAAGDALPADIAICTAAVADWKVDMVSASKLKKRDMNDSPSIKLIENPDILHCISTSNNRPKLVVGFAAETDEMEANAKEKILGKNCDWIIANDVNNGKVFGEDDNSITIITRDGVQSMPTMSKQAVASTIVERIITHFNPSSCHSLEHTGVGGGNPEAPSARFPLSRE